MSMSKKSKILMPSIKKIYLPYYKKKELGKIIWDNQEKINTYSVLEIRELLFILLGVILVFVYIGKCSWFGGMCAEAFQYKILWCW